MQTKTLQSRILSVVCSVALVAALCLVPLPVRASTVTGSNTESFPDQWLLSIGLALSPGDFQQTFNFADTVVTQKVQVSFRSVDCGGVLFQVRLPDGRHLFVPINTQFTTSNAYEFSVNPRKVNSITLFVGSTSTCELDLVVMGTAIRTQD